MTNLNYTNLIKWIAKLPTKPYSEFRNVTDSKDRELATKAYVKFMLWYITLAMVGAFFLGGE